MFSLGERIRIARGDMTQVQLAEKIGVTAMTISRWENDAYPVPLWKLHKIADATGASFQKLANGKKAA